jgi:SAM-dependent methyltransferase
MLRVLQYFILEKYCANIQNFYEFGCGTGHNLFAISEIAGNNKNYFGFDWSNPPKNIFQNIRSTYSKNFYFDNFDFFNPNNNVNIQDNSVVFTFAALEQIGDKHEKFVNFLIDKKPSICIHLEPITEVLDSNDKLQNLSIKYIQKRNYLSNFYSSLINLEKEQKIEIIDADRTTIGSYFIEGYSLIVWKTK